MSEEKWTPGPWAINPDGPRYCINKNDKQVRHIAMASCYAKTEADEKENEANAHLIYTAPDLYAELKAVEWVEDSDDYGDRWMYCPCCKNNPDVGHAEDCSLAAALKKARGES